MTSNHLVGRDTVMAALTRAIAERDEAGTAVLLSGERGIGKTACIIAARAIAHQAGCLVLETVGVDAESSFEFSSLHRLLRPVLDLTEALPATQREALLTAIGMKHGAPADFLVVSLAALSVIRQASKHKPVLISVDDINTLDSASSRVLSFISRRLDRGQVMVATSSTGQGLPVIAGTYSEVALSRLNSEESDQLLARRAPGLDDDHRDWVKAHSLGNPLALVELATVARSLATLPSDPFDALVPINPVLERAFGEQIPQVSQLARDALLVAALDGECSIQEILAAASYLSGERVSVDILDAPRAAGLVNYDETRVAFSHPLVRSAVTFREPVGRLQAAHRALGEAVVMNSGRRAWHRALGTSGRDDLIAAELERHGEDCIRRHDSDGAIAALERSAELSTTAAERGRRLLLAADRAADMGRISLADQLLTDASERDLSEFDVVRAALLRDGWNEHSDDSDRVLRLCALARHASASGEERLAVELIYRASRSGFGAVLSPSARAEVTQLADAVPHDRMDPKALASLALVDPVRYGRHVTEVLSRVDSRCMLEADKLISLCIAARGVGAYVRGLEFLEEAQTLLRIGRLDGRLASLLTLEVDLRLEIGDWNGAAAAVREIKSLTDDTRGAVRQGDALAAVAKIAALRGEVDTALALVVEMEHCPTIRRGSPALALAQLTRGIAHLSSGKHLDAYNALSRIFDPKSPSHHPREQFGAVMYLAEAAVRCGKGEDACSIVQKMESVANISGSIILMSQLQYAKAVLGPDDGADERFLGCLSSDLTASPWARARAQLAYGRWLRRQHRVIQARGPLRAALSTFQDLGAVRWAAEALDEIEASGRPGEELRAESSAASLSVQELKIARLAAMGLSNNEIGQRLSLSPRTVSSHLYRAFPKLGISARAQLASRLAQPVA